MDHVADRHPGNRNTVATAVPAVDPETVLRESRQQFVSTFAGQCDGILVRADELVATPDSGADAIGWLHRIAGLGGTLGFPGVSAKAAELEDAFRAGALTAQQLRDGIAAMRTAFAHDVTGPVAPSAAPLSHGPTLTVMVVEDEVVQRKILCAQLSQAGHSPVAVTCGEDVLAEAHAAKPDVILLDVDLPGIDGYTVCRMLKADPALMGIPVAFLSAHGTVDARLTGLSHGADDFLTKPIDPRELTLRIQLLSKRKQQADGPGTFTVLHYDMFCELAYREIQHDRCALALIRTPAGKATEVATFTRDEIRRRDLCGEYDRSHVVVLLPDTGGAAARERIGSIVEKCRANGIDGVYGGVAAATVAGGRTIEELVEEADEALAIARYENQAAAIRPDGPRREAVQGEVVQPLVLVGDDDPDVIRIVDSHLAAAGYRRVLAFDGSRTLEEVRAQKPDVLVLDLMMPRMTGFDVLAGIREMESRPRVIVLSARGREEDVIRAFSLGADDFIAKPFNPQELMARIGRLVK